MAKRKRKNAVAPIKRKIRRSLQSREGRRLTAREEQYLASYARRLRARVPAGPKGKLPNPPKLKRAPRKSGWIAATAVKFVTRNGKRTVLVRKPRRKR